MDSILDQIDELRRVATGELTHLFRGSCPDEIEGFDSRDPNCLVCRLLDETAPERVLDGIRHYVTPSSRR